MGRPTPRLKFNPPSHVTAEPKGCHIKPRSNSKAVSSLVEKEEPWLTLVVHLSSTHQPPGRISASAGEMQWQDRVPAPKERITQCHLGDLNLSGCPVKIAASRKKKIVNTEYLTQCQGTKGSLMENLRTQVNLPRPTRLGIVHDYTYV